MIKNLPKILSYLGIASIFILLLGDYLFFWYLKQPFSNVRASLYWKIDGLLENGIAILIFPASYWLFRLLKLSQLDFKIKVLFYILCSFIVPFAFFHAFPSLPGQLSFDYRSFSIIASQRLYLKVILVTLVICFIYIPLSDIFSILKNKNKGLLLKKFYSTIGCGIIMLLFAGSIIMVVDDQIFALLNRLMKANEIESTLPEIPQFTTQPYVIADHPKPVVDCYLKENPHDFGTKILNLMAGTYHLKDLGYNTYYINNYCFVAYVGAPITLSSDKDSTSMFLLAEFLIRHDYGKWIRVHAAKHPVSTITVKGEEFFKKNAERGKYDDIANTIELQEGYDRVFETTIHEFLHSFSITHLSSLNDDVGSGLDEAITQYLTAKIMNHTAASYTISVYEDLVLAFEVLLPFVDKEMVFDKYFNGGLDLLETEVDNKTYSGAYCRFKKHLDQSLFESSSGKYELAREYVDKAVLALESKEGEDLNCFK